VSQHSASKRWNASFKRYLVFDDFCHANDPHEEHDFGSFKAEGRTVFFKIDCYDKSLTHHSPDPSDPSVTERVTTIMLAEEDTRFLRLRHPFSSASKQSCGVTLETRPGHHAE
jgi:hypothetical protein